MKEKKVYFCSHCMWAGGKPIRKQWGGIIHKLCPRCKDYAVTEVKNKDIK